MGPVCHFFWGKNVPQFVKKLLLPPDVADADGVGETGEEELLSGCSSCPAPPLVLPSPPRKDIHLSFKIIPTPLLRVGAFQEKDGKEEKEIH